MSQLNVQVTSLYQKLNKYLLLDDWFDAGSLGCYKYLGEEENLTWVEAQLACEHQGGYLAEPYTQQLPGNKQSFHTYHNSLSDKWSFWEN